MSNDWMSKWPPQEVQSSVAYLNAAKHTVNFWVVLILKKKKNQKNQMIHFFLDYITKWFGFAKIFLKNYISLWFIAYLNGN